MIREWPQAKRHAVLALFALALAVRALVPAGWMPSAQGGRPTISLCTGAGMIEGWVDADGKIHKSSPDKGGKNSAPCVFALLALGFAAVALGVFLAWAFDGSNAALFARRGLAIGQGLAAPPPPARGPPLLS